MPKNKSESVETPEAFLAKWDSSSAYNRLEILSSIIDNYQLGFSIFDLLGNMSDLFYSRVLSWFKVTYKQPQGMLIKVQAIELFIKNGDEYLKSFVEVYFLYLT